MADGEVKIGITGDDSGYQKALKNTTKSARAAAAAIGAEFKKAGMSQSDAMKKAWGEVKKAQANGTTVMINGIETLIDKNEQLEESFEEVAEAAVKAGDKAGDAIAKANSGSGKLISGLKRVGTASGVAFKGISLVAGALSTVWNVAGLAMVRYNGNIEQLQTSFEVMTGSAEKGAEVLAKIRKIGAETPFETQGLAETVQLLMNYNIAADDAIDVMTMLGDVAQGDQEKLTRIATAYGQMSSAGKVTLEDIKQMIEAGFNPLAEISESTGESMASLYKRISDGKLTVAEITASMVRSTSEGGKYFQSMAKQAETLNGRLSTLLDNLQQFGGNVFQGFSNGLRDNVIPMATEIIDDLNSAFLRGGMDGLADAVVAQIPKVASAAVQCAQSAVSGVTKVLPRLLGGLFKALPQVLSSGGTIVSDLTAALFDLAAVSLENLGAQLPELASVLIPFVIEMAGNIIGGVVNGIVGLGKGIGTALKKLGILDWSTDELMEQMFSGYDPNKVQELKAKVKITPETTVDESKIQLKSVYEMIAEQLTDGKADTPEVIAELKKQVTDYYDAEIEKVNQWKQDALAGLDTSLPADEYAAAAAAIETEANTMIGALQSASDQTLVFIDQNAGKSTEAVRNNLKDLEAIYNNAVDYRDKVAVLTGEVGVMADKQREVVAAGQSRDTATQLSAIGYTAMEYETALEAAEEKKAAAMQAALEKFEKGTDAYKNEEERIRAEYDAETAKAKEEYLANMALLWSGIGEAMAPDQQVLWKEATANLNSRDLAQQLFASMATAIDVKGASNNAGDYTQWFTDMLNSMALTDVDYANLATALGIDEVDPAKIQAELAKRLSEGTAGQGANSVIGLKLSQLISDTDTNLQGTLEQMVEDMPEEIKEVVQAAIENGWLQGVEGVDLTDPNVMLSLLAGTFFSGAAATIGEQTVPVEVGVDPEITPDTPDAVQTAVGEAVEGAVESAPAVEAEPEVVVNTQVTTGENSGIEEEVKAELKDQEMDVNVKANVTLDVTLDDSNAGAVGEAAGTTIGAGVATGLESKYDDIKKAGIEAGKGFNRGLASQRHAIVATATSIARAVVRAINTALDIHSPSRILDKSGVFAGEGFGGGLTRSLRAAVASARSIVGELNLSPRMTIPDLTGAFGSAAEVLAEGYGQPIYLNVDGRTLAQVTTRENVRALNIRNKNINLGVGR